MLITKLFPSGAYEIAELIDNHLLRRTYMGLSRREALQEFRYEFPRRKRSPKQNQQPARAARKKKGLQ